jgi:subtilase family serine protease
VASQCVAPDLPDLVPTMTHSPASPGLYEQVTVTVVVHNFGNAAAGASTMTVSRNDGTPSPRSVPALNPGETYSVALTPDVFPVPGTRTYTVVVDSAGVIAESNESNNTATHSITVSQ